MIANLRNLFCALLICFLMMSEALGLKELPSPATQIAGCQGQDHAGLRARIEGANLVVAGQVRSVRPGPPSPHISEHNANWQDAVVDVSSVIQGTARPRTVVVRFPAATDIAWFQSPKLKQNEKHIFILRRDTVSGKPVAIVDGVSRRVYTALDPQDVLSEGDLDCVLTTTARPALP